MDRVIIKTVICVLALWVNIVSAQNDSICIYPEQMPSFPGTDSDYMTYIYDRLSDIDDKDLSTRVVIEFIVNKDGVIYDVVALKNKETTLTKKIICIFLEMPKWIPAKQNGENVSARVKRSFSYRTRGKPLKLVSSECWINCICG